MMARYHARGQADRAGLATYPIAQERGATARRLGCSGLWSIVVHLFAPDLRNYYQLEDLWHEGKVLLHVQ